MNRKIPVLLLKNQEFYKTTSFKNPKYLGDSINTVKLFNDKYVDEIVILDIDASKENKPPDFETIEKLCSECFMPLSYGGGITKFSQVKKLFRIGVEKIVLNTSLFQNSKLVEEVAQVYGSQSIVACIDVYRKNGQFYVRNLLKQTNILLKEQIKKCEHFGCGEIIIQDTEREGTKSGYDLELFKQASDSASVPVIALGGASDLENLDEVIKETNVSAAAAGSIFVYAGRRNAVLISGPEMDFSFDINITENKHKLDLPNIKRCKLTVLDESDQGFEVDKDGISNFAKDGITKLKKNKIYGSEADEALKKLVKKIKKEGKNKPYDCLIGLSGGLDSSFLALTVKKLGLRPLAVQVDNGWNSNVSVLNIKSIVDKLEIDLETIVLNWREIKDLQRSFFKASIPDIEVISDHAIISGHFKTAKRFGIKNIILGNNIISESIMPNSWIYSKRDAQHIRNVQKEFGSMKINDFPFMEFYEFPLYQNILKIQTHSLLSYIEFDTAKATQELKESIGYTPYPRKHGESKFTQFFQEYYLPKKFGFDKRKAHLSSLIIAGELKRDAALEVLKMPLYEDQSALMRDIEYVCNKLGFSKSEWDKIMSDRVSSHEDYGGYYSYWAKIKKIFNK